MRLLIAAVAAQLVLCGCATPYKPPASGKTATLEVRTTSDGINMPIRRYRKSDCSDYPGELVGRFNSKTIGETAYTLTTVTVPSEEPFRLSVMSVVSIKTSPGGAGVRVAVSHCQPVVEFVPATGGRYEAVHQAGPEGCSITIYTLTGGSRKLEPTFKPSSTCPASMYP